MKMILTNKITSHGNSMTYHDMLSKIRFLTTEVALGADKLFNDLFVRESINNAIVDIYDRLYSKLKYHYLSSATLNLKEWNMTYYDPILSVEYLSVETLPYKYGNITLNTADLSHTIQEILSLNMLQFCNIQKVTPEVFENLANSFNATYKQSCAYISYGSYFDLFIGEKLWLNYLSKKPDIRMSYIRRPILDDLKKVHPSINYVFTPTVTTVESYFSENYHKPIDIPNEYNRLIETLVMKDVYVGLGQPIPDNYDNIVTSLIQQLIGEQNAESNNNIPIGTGQGN